jgi:ethanolamine utilization protein EutQ (cupin superfamily)
MQQVREPESDERFEMANLFPRTTGLPMTVWVSPRGNVRHDVRVKVKMTHGNQMTISNTALVRVRPTPRVIAGQLSSSDEQAVFEWVALNADALVEYWEGRIDTIQLGQALKQLPSPQRGSASVP